jgi:hypothetical protein
MTDEQAGWLRANEGYEPIGIGGSFAGQGMLLADGTFVHGKLTPLPPRRLHRRHPADAAASGRSAQVPQRDWLQQQR